MEYTQDWKLYLSGQNYNNRLHPPYYKTIDINSSMYIGDQWKGVKANGLPTPVFNIFKRVINHQIASITSQDVKMNLVSEEMSDSDGIDGMTTGEVTKIMGSYFDQVWEKTKMTTKIRELLLDGALTGDYCIYSRWDEGLNTGLKNGIDEDGKPVPVMGDICNDIIDSVNVFFGNPNDRRVNENGRPVQPYIIIASREMTQDLKDEAEKYGSDNIKNILPDTDYEYQAGERGKIEIDDTAEGAKTTAITKLWVKNGTIHARKSTKTCTVRKEWDTKRRLYPISWGNWDTIKNSYHGQAVGTGLVPNQTYVNKLFAMAMLSVMNTAYPKIVYDRTRVSKPTNMVGATYGVDGETSNAIRTMNGADMSPQVMQLIDKTIAQTKEMLGASDAAMGDVRPENTSAIIAVQQASAVPLETIKQNMYQFIEDLGYIWLDSMIAYYGNRKIKVVMMEEEREIEIDFGKLSDMRLRIKIDVGATGYWTEIVAAQTLDNLLMADRITFVEYLERVQDGIIPKKQSLIESRKEQEAISAENAPVEQQPIVESAPTEQEMEMMAQFFESLPPETQAQLQSLGEEEMYLALQQMMQAQ